MEGDARVPTLLGVACVDMNLILTTNPYPNPNPYPNQVGCIDMNLVVALDTVRARNDWYALTLTPPLPYP